MSRRWLAACALLAACGAPAPVAAPGPPRAAPAPTNWVCAGLLDHFVGLPSRDTAPGGAVAPTTGCWWVRDCELGLTDDVAGARELEVRLRGPGWYWIDVEEGDFTLHQQVPFELDASVAGSVRWAHSGGVISFWFEPTRPARVAVEASTELELHGATLWGSVLRRIPLVPIRQLAAARLSESAAAAFAEQLQRGVTVTYDVGRGQADMALGALAPGETPRRVFEDESTWIENTRLRLPAQAAHVFGPLEPLPIDLDVVIERGPGVTYRALCARDMPACFDDLAAGQPGLMPREVIVASGTLRGPGAHAAALHVRGCPHYLAIASAGDETTLAALRLRASAAPNDAASAPESASPEGALSASGAGGGAAAAPLAPAPSTPARSPRPR